MRHTVKLPDNISDEARFWAAKDNLSIDSWMARAVERECTRRSLAVYAAQRSGVGLPDSEPTVNDVPGGENDNRPVSQG